MQEKYRIIERQNCFGKSKFYVEEQLRGGPWRPAASKSEPTYENALAYIKALLSVQYNTVVKITEISLESFK